MSPQSLLASESIKKINKIVKNTFVIKCDVKSLAAFKPEENILREFFDIFPAKIWDN